MSAVLLTLPYPGALPSRRSDLAIAARGVLGCDDLDKAFDDPITRSALRRRLSARESLREAHVVPGRAEDEQAEHDRYFHVTRSARNPADGFATGLLNAHLAVHEDCLDMGVTLLAEPEWDLLFVGLEALLRGAGCTWRAPALPSPTGWRTGYDPPRRWLAGHQLFFSLIQGAIVGLNCFATAVAAGQTAEADEGLRLAAAFMRSSAATMKLTSDFAPDDYERTVRPAMAPPKVRSGFSGLQTRDHAYLVRLFGALRPVFLTLSRPSEAHDEFIESVVSAYAAHEFICARFRGDVLPSLRMEAASRGRTRRSGTAVIREMMRARLALVDPAMPSGDREGPP
jgi:hypothetical protein